MPDADSPPPGFEQAKAQCLAWLGQVRQLLQQQEGELLARQRAVEARLRQAGLDSPQAIQAAYEALDASERQALERQLQDGAAAAPAPAAAPGLKAMRRHLGRML